MPAIPYRLTDDLKSVLNWPSLFYRFMEEILIQSHALDVSIKLLPKEFFHGINRDSVCAVLKHVVVRTFQFNKIAEFIKIEDFIDGVPSVAAPGCGLRHRQVKYTLKQLVAGDWLIKLRLSSNRALTPMYGLNVPVFLKVVQTNWQGELDIRDSRKDYADQETKLSRLGKDADIPIQAISDLAIKSLCLLEYCLEFSDLYKPMFKLLSKQRVRPIENWKQFLNDLKKLRPSQQTSSRSFSALQENIKECSLANIRRKRRKNSGHSQEN